MEETVLNKTVTYDLERQMEGATLLKCSEYGQAIVDNMDKPAHGGGEPALVGIAAVIATGIHDATGARLFRLPMTPPRVKEALGKV